MDKQHERTLALKVYGPSFASLLTEGECPDFTLDVGTSETLGVEVTEFFPNETEARLQRIAGYNSHLLEGGVVRHKDDKRLRVEAVTYHSADAQASFPVTAIILPQDPVANRRALRSLINSKGEACRSRYAPARCDLLINDALPAFNQPTTEQLALQLLTRQMRWTLRKSPFREVFFVTHLDGSSFCMPLKAVCFASDMLTLRKLVSRKRFARRYDAKQRIGSALAALVSLGYGEALLWFTDGQITIRYASVDVIWDGSPFRFSDNCLVRARPDGAERLDAIEQLGTRPLTAELLKQRRGRSWRVAFGYAPRSSAM